MYRKVICQSFSPRTHRKVWLTANTGWLQSSGAVGYQRLPWKTGESTRSLENPEQFPSTCTLENDQKQSAKFKELLVTVPWAGEKTHRRRGEEMVTRSSCFLPKALQWLLRTCRIIPKPFPMSCKALHDLAPPPSDHLSSSSLATVNLLLSFEHAKLISVSRPSCYVFQLEDLRHQSPSGCLRLVIVSLPQNGTPLDQLKTIPPSDHSLSHYHILLSP